MTTVPKEESSLNVKKIGQLLEATAQVIVDKDEQIKLCVTCLLAGGHLLIEDLPGMGKTSLIKTLSKLLGLPTQRIQFTNDLLPADIIGTSIFNRKTESFSFHKGPLFANFVLADEINRATPKTQSACLQAMEEFRVNVDRETYELPTPFFLVATQNPQDNIGTFALPDSQLDRFLMRLELGPPSRQAEREILTGRDRNKIIEDLPSLFNVEEIRELIRLVELVHVSDSALDYVQDIVESSRKLNRGLSPRGARDLNRAAKSYAFVSGRNFVVPEDYQKVGAAVMGHRLSPEDGRLSHGEQIAKELLHSVAVP